MFDGLTEGDRKRIAERERRMKEDAELREREVKVQAEREARENAQSTSVASSIAKQREQDSARYSERTSSAAPSPAAVSLPARPVRYDFQSFKLCILMTAST